MPAALEGGEVSASRLGHSLPPGKDPVPFVQETGWVPGPVWTNAENFALSGIFLFRYDFIQCSIAVHTRDVIGNKKSLSDVTLSVVF